MQFCHKHPSWRFSVWVILVFYFFDLADHFGSPRCYQPNWWVIGVVGFLVVVLVDMFFSGFLRFGIWVSSVVVGFSYVFAGCDRGWSERA